MREKSESGINQHKRMAMGERLEGEGSFGVEHHGRDRAIEHPDHGKAHGHLRDHERGAGRPVHHTEGHMPSQANPDHGPHHHELHEDHEALPRHARAHHVQKHGPTGKPHGHALDGQEREMGSERGRVA